MFVTKKTLAIWNKHHEAEQRLLNDRYWELWHKYERLLRHLGLVEVTVPEKTVLEAKGSSEKDR